MNIDFTAEEMFCIAFSCFKRKRQANKLIQLYEESGDADDWASEIAELKCEVNTCDCIIAKLDIYDKRKR